MKFTPKTVAIAAGVVLLGSWYVKRQAGDAVAAVGQAVNPVNPENIVNRGFHGVYDVFTDGKGTLGTDLYDWWNDE
jgi:hypothetical protein